MTNHTCSRKGSLCFSRIIHHLSSKGDSLLLFHTAHNHHTQPCHFHCQFSCCHCEFNLKNCLQLLLIEFIIRNFIGPVVPSSFHSLHWQSQFVIKTALVQHFDLPDPYDALRFLPKLECSMIPLEML
uniref:Uncharacterized protein n=1 Tax=Arundo donax TaxID=35708 RepID=A0A0A9D9Z0_ARUDO